MSVFGRSSNHSAIPRGQRETKKAQGASTRSTSIPQLVERKPIVFGISGAPGSFSELAGEQYLRGQSGGRKYRFDYLISVENVLAALDAGTIELGIFPIENSVGGVVIEAVEAMSGHNFKILEYLEIFVHHHLMVKPGTKRDDVHAVTSHVQALRQCGLYLRRNWPNARIVEHLDTAEAARQLAQGLLAADTAVIASAKAADKYGLFKLDERIQDTRDNNTHFIVVERRA